MNGLHSCVLVFLLNLCAVIGNVTVFVWRCRKGNNERCSILSMMIVHLAFFDFICGAYYVYNGGLILANVFNVTNGTISATDYETYKRMLSCPLAAYFASFYTSDWMTLSIATYSLAIITPWKSSTTRIIGGVSFLVAWMIFVSSLAANGYMMHLSTAATVKLDSGNKTHTLEWAFWSLFSTSEIRYLFVCKVLSAGFVIITGGLYLLAVLPRVRQWEHMNNRSFERQSLSSGLCGRLLAIVLVNLSCTLFLIGFLVSCWDNLLYKYSIKKIEECPIDPSYGKLIMMVPPAINPILYTAGTPKFLQKPLAILKASLPLCQCRHTAQEEQPSLLAEPHICTACCLVWSKHRQSFSSESVQTSKLFSESLQHEVNMDEFLLELSSSSEEKQI